jgi:predicted heme/steroid binding protein
VTKNIAIATFISSILGLAMIGGALYWQLKQTNSDSSPAAVSEPADRSFTLEELARYDGKDGNDCLVAVDGEVYLIEGFALWQEGEHVPSGGRARCGFDLTEVMDEESPHGRNKLPLLKKVGTLEGGTTEESPSRPTAQREPLRS